MHPAGSWTGLSRMQQSSMMPTNDQVDKENGAISQDSAWGGLIKKRLQPLLDLINYSVYASTHSLPDESVDNNDNCDENNKNKNCTRRVHQRLLSLAG